MSDPAPVPARYGDPVLCRRGGKDRWRNIRSPEFASELRTRLWGGEFDDDFILRVTFDSVEEHGIAPADLVGEDYGPCQQWAEQIRNDVPGIVVPSAALPGTENLTHA